MPSVLVLQHIACEPPGVFEDVLVERGVALHRVELDQEEPLPDWRDFDGIVAMGGPMSVNDEAEHPWLVAEKRLIGAAVRAGRPYWGSCLGAQLLAAALGAEVRAGPSPEVGVLPVFPTAAARHDPVFAGLGSRPLLTLQWHGDTFDLPEGAELLAGSPAYAHQVFRFGQAYGVQFHVEVTAAMAKEWAAVPAYREAAEQVLGPGGLAELLRSYERELDAVLAQGRLLFEAWFDATLGREPERARPARHEPERSGA